MSKRAWRYNPADVDGTAGDLADIGSNRGAFMWAATPAVGSTGANGMVIAHFTNSVVPSQSYIKLYFTANSSLTLSYSDGINSGSGAWNTTSNPLNASTEYQFLIDYDGSSHLVTLGVDGVTRIEIDPATIRFVGNSGIDRYALGQNSTGGDVYTSATFAPPVADTWLY